LNGILDIFLAVFLGERSRAWEALLSGDME
jgi:hypothetical protein